MSASLDSFFIFTLLSSQPLFPSVSSLLKEKKKNYALPVFHSCCLIFWFSFFLPFLTHPHTIFTIGKQQPIQPVAYSGLRATGWLITWFDGSYYRPGFPGQDAGIFIEADKGRSKTSHPPEAEDNLTQVWFMIIFLAFEGNVKYDLLPPPSHRWKTFSSHS